MTRITATGSERPAAPATTDELDADDLSEFEDEFDDTELDGVTQPEPDPEGPAPTVVALDIGEVLIDESRVWAIWAELCGVSPLSFAAVMGAAIAQGADHLEVFAHVAPNIEWEAFVEEHERRYGGFSEDDLYPDGRPCLEELRELGFRVVVAGNQPAARGEQLRALGLAADAVITSGELGMEKPDPGFFTALLRLAEVADAGELLYVGDRVDNDVLPAQAAGARTCWLRRGPWGQLQELPGTAEPDLVLDGLGELALLLSHWREGPEA